MYLFPQEEHILFQLEEGIDALEAAIEYKNECIQSRQQVLKESSQILTQSENHVIEKFSSFSAAETRSILVKYFKKVGAGNSCSIALFKASWKKRLSDATHSLVVLCPIRMDSKCIVTHLLRTTKLPDLFYSLYSVFIF